MRKKLALARVNYSQLYAVYDDGKTFQQRDILVPYHLLALAAYARAQGAEVRLFDAEVDLWSQEQLAREVLAWQPDVVGLTATTPDIDLAVEVCGLIKAAAPHIVTVIGGSHARVRPAEVAAQPAVDFVVVGDGEEVLCALLADATADAARAPEQKIRHGQRQDLARLPMPAHDLLDYAHYQFTDPTRGRQRTASVMSARGCPFTCNFCYHDRHVRYRHETDFVAELAYLYREKGVRYFFFYDDVFLLKKERVLRILAQWRALGYTDARFQCQSRGNLMDPEVLAALHEAGCVRVSLGIESGSDAMLQRCSKGVTKEDCRRACHQIAAAGMEPRASFIIGHPYETAETVRATIDFAKELDILHANFTVMTPYPGTQVHEMALRGQGIRFVQPEFATQWSVYRRWGQPIIATDALDAAAIQQWRETAVTEFYTQEKVFAYYQALFDRGNRSRYFYRPLNFAWRRHYGRDVPFWERLEETGMVAPR